MSFWASLMTRESNLCWLWLTSFCNVQDCSTFIISTYWKEGNNWLRGKIGHKKWGGRGRTETKCNIWIPWVYRDKKNLIGIKKENEPLGPQLIFENSWQIIKFSDCFPEMMGLFLALIWSPTSFSFTPEKSLPPHPLLPQNHGNLFNPLPIKMQGQTTGQ